MSSSFYTRDVFNHGTVIAAHGDLEEGKSWVFGGLSNASLYIEILWNS
jgi:hypothetical protein